MRPGLPLRIATELASSAGQDPAAKPATTVQVQEAGRPCTGPALGLHWALQQGNCEPGQMLPVPKLQTWLTVRWQDGWAGLDQWAIAGMGLGPCKRRDPAGRQKRPTGGAAACLAGQRKPRSSVPQPSLLCTRICYYYVRGTWIRTQPHLFLSATACYA